MDLLNIDIVQKLHNWQLFVLGLIAAGFGSLGCDLMSGAMAFWAIVAGYGTLAMCCVAILLKIKALDPY